MIQMAAMAVLARPIVDRNLSGWHMAYQRSTEMNVSVNTETDTETVCKKTWINLHMAHFIYTEWHTHTHLSNCESTNTAGFRLKPAATVYTQNIQMFILGYSSIWLPLYTTNFGEHLV